MIVRCSKRGVIGFLISGIFICLVVLTIVYLVLLRFFTSEVTIEESYNKVNNEVVSKYEFINILSVLIGVSDNNDLDKKIEEELKKDKDALGIGTLQTLKTDLPKVSKFGYLKETFEIDKLNGGSLKIYLPNLNDKNPDVLRQHIIDYGLQFVGGVYQYGANGPRRYDCSSYVQSLYKQFGKSLPRTSSQQRLVGTLVCDGWQPDKVLPGDIVCYKGHVGLYMGDNKLLHASNRKTGIKISNNVNYRPVVCVRRVF